MTPLQFHLLVVTLAWTGAWAVRFRYHQWTWLQHVGLALVLYPFARLAVNVALTVRLLTVYTVLPAYTEWQLWEKVIRHALIYFLIPLTGLLLMRERLPGVQTPLRDAPREAAAALRAAGSGSRWGVARDTMNGLALFLPILVAYLVSYWVLYTFFEGLLVTGDESQVFRNVTLPLILALSLVAGVSEEFLFRGVLLGWLRRLMPSGNAAVAQAIFFGFIHAGYGTWSHVMGPMLFGLGMAWVALRLGVIPAMVLHGAINTLFFSVDVLDVRPEAAALPLILLALNGYAAWRVGLDPYRRLLPRRLGGAPPGSGGGDVSPGEPEDGRRAGGLQ